MKKSPKQPERTECAYREFVDRHVGRMEQTPYMPLPAGMERPCKAMGCALVARVVASELAPGQTFPTRIDPNGERVWECPAYPDDAVARLLNAIIEQAKD